MGGVFKEVLSSLAQTFRAARVATFEPLHFFAAGLALAAVGFGLVLVAVDSPGVPLWTVLLLGALAAFSERQTVRISHNLEMTISVLPMLFAAVVFGPLAAMLVGALGLIVDFKRPYTRWLVWSSMRALAGGMAGAAAFLVTSEGTSFGHLLLAVALASLVDALIDAGLGSFVVRLRGTGGCRDYLRSMKPILLGTVPLYTPVVVLLAYAYEELSHWSVLLFLAPAFAAHRLYGLYREQREATEKLTRANERLERASLSFASALVAALDARDEYTAGHSAAVAIYARDIAARLGLPDEDRQLAHLCGLVHDIGKVGLPAGLLEKPGPLTLEERRRMEEHPVIGERILAKVDDYAEIARIVRHHHERIDGCGYPDGLESDDIPMVSRIIAVADAYNAMTSDRPYRDAMPSRVARLRLAQAVDTQFDTAVVAAFEVILASANDTYLCGASADFAVEAQRHPGLRVVAIAGAA